MKKILNKIKIIYLRELFQPSLYLGIFINPFFIIRRDLMINIKSIAVNFNNGLLLDIGCGSKPYKCFFNVDKYVGIELFKSGHNHKTSKIDLFYDGKIIPFKECSFDYVFSSEVFQQVFDFDTLLSEINRVLKKGGKLAFTCPFVWDEHEKPYDYARYTSFGLAHILQKNGFRVILLKKTTPYFLTIIQMTSAYFYQHVLPSNRLLRTILALLIVSPMNILGLVLNNFFPKNFDFYHNNIVIAQKD